MQLRQVEVEPHVASFFYLFSRFEFALKRFHCLKDRRDGRRAEADWKSFLNKCDALGLWQKIGDAPEIKYIVDHPPAIQIVRIVNGCPELVWKDCNYKIDSIHNLARAVRQTRNNLFHGEKFPGRPIGGSERDRDLILSAAAALRLIAEAVPDFRHLFEDST